jgi:CP family cyanate transporter-like MFS transporter
MMTGAASPGSRRRVLVFLGALFLVALNLRVALASLPPLVDAIRRDTGLSSFGVGLLTTVPVLCMGALAPFAPRVGRRLGPERAVAAGLAVLAAGLALRQGGGSVPILFGSTLVAGVGIAVVGAVIPGIVRAQAAQRAGAVTGLYATAMAAGATVAAGVAVPLADLMGSWEGSLAVWSALALAALAAWTPVVRAAGPPQRAAGVPVRLPWRDRTAWLVTGFAAIQSLLFFSQLAWIAPAYVDEGWSERSAGWLLSAYGAGGVAATIVAPALSDRVRDRRVLLVAAIALAVAGLALLATAPGWAPWATVPLLGFGQTAAFALGLVLLVVHAGSPGAAAALTGMAFTVAYLVAAVGPALLGLLRDATGAFTTPFLVILALDLLAIGLAIALRPERRVATDASIPVPARMPAAAAEAVTAGASGRRE